ncbi:site-2 protease family protein [Balneola sp. MJW-20]|uniref:site-2 protease family protein n=1 Tax=Gracilimonas aurantiaca TaxID=3234185 RepID=UPI0034674A61
MSNEDLSQNIFADYEVVSSSEEQKNKPDLRTKLKHLGLFLLTFLFVTLSGANFVGFEPVLFPVAMPGTEDILRGLLFAVLFLGFLTTHEFGHYFAAVYHKVRVTLPYYIPLPVGIGTLGAVIRIKERVRKVTQLFDIGVAGPVAGFIVSLIILIIGFINLPEPEFMLNFAGHEELKEYIIETGEYPDFITDDNGEGVLTVGNTLLFSLMSSFADNMPPMWEMYHFPFLFAGWLGLFFTALNLMPVGQLDGGHILYSLIGYKKHKIVARIFFTGLTILAGIEMIPLLSDLLTQYLGFGLGSWFIWGSILYLVMQKAFRYDTVWINAMLAISLAVTLIYNFIFPPEQIGQGSLIWVVWTFITAFFIGVEHPPVQQEEELTFGRRVIGWISMLIFVLCISINPLFTS